MTMNTRRSDELLKQALEDAVAKGYLHNIDPSHPIMKRGLEVVDEQQEREEKAAEPCEWPHWANWRLVLLQHGEDAKVVYFTRKPSYAEKKAFCAIAGISPEDLEVEERL